VTVTCAAVVTTKVLFGICDYTVDNDVGTSDLSHVLRTSLWCGHAHMSSHVSPGMAYQDAYSQGIFAISSDQSVNK